MFLGSSPEAQTLGRAFGQADLHARVQVFGEDLSIDGLWLVFNVDDAQGDVQRHIGQGGTAMVLQKTTGRWYGIAMRIMRWVPEMGGKGFGLRQGEHVLLMLGLLVPFRLGETGLLGKVMLP